MLAYIKDLGGRKKHREEQTLRDDDDDGDGGTSKKYSNKRVKNLVQRLASIKAEENLGVEEKGKKVAPEPRLREPEPQLQDKSLNQLLS